MATLTSRVTTGLHREPTFEELVRRRDPTLHVPVRSAWELRNSPFMSVFDAVWQDGVASLGLLDHLHDEGDQLAQNRTMAEMYRQAGVPYRAQGGGGGPPAYTPPALGQGLQQSGAHQDAVQQHMSTAAVTAVNAAMQSVLNAQSVASQIETSVLPEHDDVYREPIRDPATMARNYNRARQITHSVMQPSMAILGAAAGVSYEATATILGALGHAMGKWAENHFVEVEDDADTVPLAARSRKPTEAERNPETAHAEFLKAKLHNDGAPSDSGGSSSSWGPGPRPPRGGRNGRSGSSGGVA